MFLVIMFLEQWIVLEVLLLLLSRIIKMESSIKRVTSAAITGSLLGCGMVIIPTYCLLWKILMLLSAIFATVRISFSVKGKKLILTAGYLLIISVFFGGIWTALWEMSGEVSWLPGFVLSIGIGYIFYKGIIENFFDEKDFLYHVTFQWNHKTFQVCGYLDTGNCLFDPFSKMPVSVMEESVFLEYFSKPLTKMINEHSVEDIRIIPFHSVGRKNGVMTGILVTDMKITNGNRRIEVGKGVIGVTKDSLCASGNYQMLIHPNLICGRL